MSLIKRYTKMISMSVLAMGFYGFSCYAMDYMDTKTALEEGKKCFGNPNYKIVGCFFHPKTAQELLKERREKISSIDDLFEDFSEFKEQRSSTVYEIYLPLTKEGLSVFYYAVLPWLAEDSNRSFFYSAESLKQTINYLEAFDVMTKCQQEYLKKNPVNKLPDVRSHFKILTENSSVASSSTRSRRSRFGLDWQ